MGKSVGRTGLEEKISSQYESVFEFVAFEMWTSKWRCLVNSWMYEFGVQGGNPQRKHKYRYYQYMQMVFLVMNPFQSFSKQRSCRHPCKTESRSELLYTYPLTPRNCNKKHEVSFSKHLTLS